jgi:hypothetical protein
MQLSVWAFTAALAMAFASSQAMAQETTNTNCTLNGNTANCTSTKTDNAEQQRRAYEAGQQLGNALGVGIARAVRAGKQAKWVKNFCARHPGGGWYWHVGNTITDRGTCPTDDDRDIEAANLFMSRHKDYVPEQANSTIMVAYLESHNLDPREEKSYEKGYKDLKKSGRLHLYSK